MSRNKFHRDFFEPQEPLPVFVPPPSDPTLVQRIKKLADYVCRNGPEFVSLFKDRQQHNPEYGFLVGGEGHDYYKWCLHCCLTNESMDQPQEVPQNIQKDKFEEILDSLDGSKDSIRAGQMWFMKHLAEAEDLANKIYRRIIDSEDSARQIRVFYLIDEILFKNRGNRYDENRILEVFRPLISPLLSTIISGWNQIDETIKKLKKIISSWYDDGIYDKTTLAQFEAILRNSNTELEMINSRTSDHEPDKTLEMRTGTSTLPPHIQTFSKFTSSQSAWEMVEGSRQGRKMDPTRAAFDPPPSRVLSEKKPHNCFSFPPGLIPKLVSEKGKHSFSYSQISPDDLEQSGQPILVDANDPYLKSRMQKFYAELEEYRPGMVREQIESRKREDEVEIESESQKRRRQRGSYSLAQEDRHTSMLPDGSFAGEGSDSMYAGLGARTQPRISEEDYVFESYRKLRSDVYHNSIPKGQGNVRKPRI